MPSSRNPFKTLSTEPNVTKSQPTSIETSLQASSSTAPAMSLSSLPGSGTSPSGPPPQPDLDNADLEEPPPYTPSASVANGEATIEVGPHRPFQAAPQSANPPQNGLPQAHNQVAHHRIPSSSSPMPSPSSRPTPSERITQQLTNTLTNVVNRFNTPSTSFSINTGNYNSGAASRPTGQSWTSYPGQNAQSTPPPSSNPPPRNAHLLPPPRHPYSSTSLQRQPPPLSTSSQSLPSMADHSSDFARDFYAAGTGDGEALVTESIFTPPTGPPPSEGQASTTRSVVPSDGRPTSEPKPGHPLLHDGQLLVYPIGYECRKCHNVGYKDANPLKPCKHCWKKYSKPFAGALVYSFPANTASSSASNFQKPLPNVPPSASRLRRRASHSSPPPSAAIIPGGQVTNQHGGFRNPPPSFHPPNPTPMGGSVTYMAGDPRIGGVLCRRCYGNGTVGGFGLFFDLETCPLCKGVGRLFL